MNRLTAIVLNWNDYQRNFLGNISLIEYDIKKCICAGSYLRISFQMLPAANHARSHRSLNSTRRKVLLVLQLFLLFLWMLYVSHEQKYPLISHQYFTCQWLHRRLGWEIRHFNFVTVYLKMYCMCAYGFALKAINVIWDFLGSKLMPSLWLIVFTTL